MIYGLTQLGVVHTIISVIAVVAGAIAFIKYGKILPACTTGKVYVITTILTCLTSFGIFQHGGFGKAHVLGIITLVVLGVAALAGRTTVFGRASAYVETISYTLTFLFHMIPTITEGSTRLPYGHPLLPNADAPELQTATGALFVLFLIGVAWQVKQLRAARARTAV
jgi:uncharacterized membrane protein